MTSSRNADRPLPGVMVCAVAPRLVVAALLLSSCAPGLPGGTEVARVETRAEPPAGADPDGCYARDVAPAVVETVTDQALVQPAQIASDGSVLYPGVYRTETRQEIVRPRTELWFQTPCEGDLTPDFVASLQRALKVRGQYRGPITGTMDARTRRAVRAFQRAEGLDSAILSLAAARQLGLIEVGAEEAPADFDPDPTELPG